MSAAARRVAGVSALAAIAALVACGDDNPTDPNGVGAIARVSADSQTTAAGVAMSQPLVVLVTTKGGTPVANAPVEWSIGTGGGSMSDTVVFTDADGHAQTTYTPGTIPVVGHVTAQAASLPGLTFTVTITAGPATSVAKFGSDSPAAIVGSTISLGVRLADTYGNSVSGGVVNWSSNSGVVGAATSTTDSGGVATVAYTMPATAGTYTLTATHAGLPPVTFTIVAI